MLKLFSEQRWKKRHSIGLLITASVGAAVGIAIAVYRINPEQFGLFRVCDMDPLHEALYARCWQAFNNEAWLQMISQNWATILFWPIAGIIIGAAIVPFRQLTHDWSN